MVKDYLKPSVQGVGYLGEKTDSLSLEYVAWHSMMKRCYSAALHVQRPSYKNCAVDLEWHDFRNFRKWMVKQKNWNIVGFELDKDLRVLGNKIYGPKTCSFVPRIINLILSGNNTSKHGLGVRQVGNRFLAKISRLGKEYRLGSYSTRDEAVFVSLTARLVYIRELAKMHKSNLHRDVYSNLRKITIEEVEKLREHK